MLNHRLNKVVVPSELRRRRNKVEVSLELPPRLNRVVVYSVLRNRNRIQAEVSLELRGLNNKQEACLVLLLNHSNKVRLD
jgi:hypothetical protein